MNRMLRDLRLWVAMRRLGRAQTHAFRALDLAYDDPVSCEAIAIVAEGIWSVADHRSRRREA